MVYWNNEKKGTKPNFFFYQMEKSLFFRLKQYAFASNKVDDFFTVMVTITQVRPIGLNVAANLLGHRSVVPICNGYASPTTSRFRVKIYP